jgi:Arc/MetJ-type ribon-helix-helix transcriptional regulator
MSKKIHFTLPSPLGKWVQTQAERRGYTSPDHFVAELLRREKALEARQRIDAMLIEALESGPSTPMTSKDWNEIRQTGRRRFLERRKK